MLFLGRLAKFRARRTAAAGSKKPARSRLRIESLEDRRLLTVSPLSYVSTGGAMTIDISADHLSYEIRNGSNAVVAQQLIANTSEIDIQGSLSGTNSLTLNFANALHQPTAVSYSAQSSSQGSIVISNATGPALPIDYALFTSTADSITDDLAAAVRNFAFTDDGTNPETVVLSAGATSGTVKLEATNAVPVTFANPATSLSISEDGVLADTIAVNSVDSNFSGSLSMIGGNDTIDVVPTAFKGSLTVNAGGGTNSTINIEPSTLTVAGKATFLASSIFVNSTSITTTGNQTYGGAVKMLSTPVTIAATTANVVFGNTLDGATNLTVNAASATFAAAVGSLTQLKSLTVNAGTIDVGSTISTSGSQVFSDPTPAGMSGHVYVDANDNGTFDTGETALAGVVVTLTGTNDLGVAVSLTATTAADGSYSFINLRPGTYTLTETQPSGYLVGTSSVGSQGGTLGSGAIASIALTNGTVGTGNDFAELLPSSLSGYVYVDANDNGTFDAGEVAISGATVTLSGTNDLGGAVSLTATTAVNGAYSFSNLRPGTYKLTETRPSGYTDGDLTIGTQGGTAGTRSISGIAVASGTNGLHNDFANLAPASLSGFVYLDANDNGAVDAGELGLSGVTVTLTGTDNHGNAVSLTTTTTNNGAYSFGNLVPGTYTLTETEPAGDLPGTDSIGSQNGTVGSGVLSNIQLGLGVSGTNNNFAELKAASLSGYAYVDANGNGTFDSGETALAGVTITLAGTDDFGNSINLTTTTAAGDPYLFSGLRPGSYTLTETVPTGYVASTISIGSQATGTVGSGVLSAVALASGISGNGNNFANVLGSQVVQTVDLSGSFNLTGITANGAKFTGGLDGVGNALSGSLLGTSQVWNGVNFSIGAAGSNNVVQATGQTIALPAGQYTKLEFLATAVQGNQKSQTFTVNYTDGTSTTLTQSISDWYTPQNFAGEAVVAKTAYRNMAGGGADHRSFNVYGYSISVDSSKTVASITLPSDKNVDVLAISTVATVAPPTNVTTVTDFSLIISYFGSGSSGGIGLSWTAPTGSITGYNVYRGTTAGGESTTPLNSSPLSATSTGYLDTSAVPGNTYYYVVQAINGPATSANSNEASGELASASGNVAVDLGAAFNKAGITSDGAKFTGGLDGIGDALSGTVLGTSQTWNGANFMIGAAGSNNVVQASGQTIALPPGQYAELDLLATAVNGSQLSQKFTIEYTDGTSSTVTQSISDWHTPQSYAGESVAIATTYRNTAGGGKDGRAFDVYGYRLPVDSTKTVSAIVLPNDTHVEVLAITAIAPVATPTGLTANAASSGEIDLSWTAPTGAVTGYDIYRGTVSGGESATPLNATPLGASATSFQDTSVTPGNTYYYVIRAINGPVASAISAEASATAPTSGTTTQVDLSSAVNKIGITTSGLKFTGGLDGVGNSLSGTLLGTSQNWNGSSFTIGAAGTNNVVQAAGQTIALPAGQYSKVELLATSVNGNQAGQVFVVHYTDGTSTSITQSLSDWFTPQGYAGESTAVTTVSRNTSAGGSDNRTFYVYGYVFAVDSSKTIASITLPTNQHVDIVAIDAVQ